MKTKFSGILTLLLAFVVHLSFAQTKTVSGTIIDDSGLPLPGATVLIKGTTTGTSSDFDGNFSITANQGATLVFSFVGYVTKEVVVGTSNSINVTLNEDTGALDEVVIVGYGEKKRGDLSSSVSTISAVQLEKLSGTVSIDNSLQGAATGVQVVAQNGKPGNAAFIRIRGIGSINAGSEPLYLFDGVQVSEDDIIGINPSDIQSISVLKDAASTAIYGARGANGVILITSRTGKMNTKSQFRLHTRIGIGQETKRNFRVMNAREKLEYERAIGIGVGSTITDPARWNELIANDHDWSDDILKKSQIRSTNLSVSGGGENMSYFLSLAHDQDTGIIELIDNAFERTSARLNVDYQARPGFKISTKLGFSTSEDQDPRDRNNIQNPVNGRFTFNPYEPVYLYDADGNFILDARGMPTFNPTHQGLSSLEQVRANTDRDTENRWFGSFAIDAEIAKNLNYTLLANGTYTQFTYRGLLHAGSALDLVFYGTPTGTADYDNRSQFLYSFVNKFQYQKTFNEKHNFTANFLTEFQRDKYERAFARGLGYVVNGPTTLDVAATPNSVLGGNATSSLFSIAGSIDYNYDEKYLLTATVRRDGSSRFGANTKYGTFWGTSAAWNVSNETFFSNNIISNLKLRVSAGTSGNDQIGRNPSKTLYAFYAYNGLNAAVPYQFGDPNLGWEQSLTLGAGLEFGLFNNRVTGVIDYYKRTTSDLLLNAPITYTQGGDFILKNIGEIENSGIEFELRGDVITTENFNWSLGASLSLYDNKVNKLVDENDIFTDQNFYTGLRVGERVHTFYLARYQGVNPANGQALFLDTAGNVTTTNNGGEVFLSGKSPYATFDGGFNSRMSYKGFELTADFYYKGGNYIFNTVEQQLLSDGTGAVSNQRVDAWNYWRQPGDVNVLPDPTTNNPYRSEANGNSDRYLQKGDYIRLRNLQFSYSIPSKFLEKTSLTQVKVYVSGTNLWTYTPYYKGDPEVGIGSEESYVTNDPTRTLIPGEFSLNSYPTLTSYMFGVDVKF